jgi:RHS repeat-associated protein
LAETYIYDRLDRLTSAGGLSASYDNLGRLQTRQRLTEAGTETLTYGYSGASGGSLHAVSAIGSSLGAENGVSYSYDENGNIIWRDAAAMTWTAFNKSASVSGSSGRTSRFLHGAGLSRARHTVEDASGVNLRRTFYYGGIEQTEGYDAQSGWQNEMTRLSISSPSGVIGQVRFTQSGEFEASYYLRDHLGSIVAEVDADLGPRNPAMDADGLNGDDNTSWKAFDAWGSPRDPETWGWLDSPDAADPTTSTTERGYTGHEMLPEAELIHMNGRLYDPRIARFVSPDPFVQAPSLGQNYNRYSYVLNNPLRYTDPTGYMWDLGYGYNDYLDGSISGWGESNLNLLHQVKYYRYDTERIVITEILSSVRVYLPSPWGYGFADSYNHEAYGSNNTNSNSSSLANGGGNWMQYDSVTVKYVKTVVISKVQHVFETFSKKFQANVVGVSSQTVSSGGSELANGTAASAQGTGTVHGLILFDTSSNNRQDKDIEEDLRRRVEIQQNHIANADKRFEFRTYGSQDDLNTIASEFEEALSVFNVTHGTVIDGEYVGFTHAGKSGVSEWGIRRNIRDTFGHDSTSNCFNHGCGMNGRGEISVEEAWTGGSSGRPRRGSILHELNKL